MKKTQSNVTPKTGFQNCPVLGVGLGLRSELFQETLEATDLIDWLEFTPENVMGFCPEANDTYQELLAAHVKYPLVSHGVSMSIGSADPFDETYMTDLEAVFKVFNPPWFSDHLTFSSIGGRYFHDLIPLPRQAETVDYIAQRLKYLSARFNRPVLVENASFYVQYPDDALSDAAFHRDVVEAADCGLLLDVNNVYVNSQNHGFDPQEYIASLPLERVVQIHVAGHHDYPEAIIDTHGNPVKEDVWTLLDWTMQRCSPCGVMIERDNNYPDFSELRDELGRLREIWDRTQVGVLIC